LTVFPLGPDECASRALTLTSGDEKAELSESDQEEESEDTPKKDQGESPPQVSRSVSIMEQRAASKAALIEKYKAILSELTLPGGELSINEGTHGESQAQVES
jgi:hypothetical protein